MTSKLVKVVSEPHTFRLTNSTNFNQNRFTPNEETNNSLLYHLSLELDRQDIVPMALLILPFQYLLIASTTAANTDVSKLAQNFHSNVSRDLNQQQGQSGQLWKRQPLGYLALLTVFDLLEELANLITQGVKQGYISDPDDWHGIYIRAEGDRAVSMSATQPDYCGAESTKSRSFEIAFFNSPLIDQSSMTLSEFEHELKLLVKRKIAEIESVQTECGEQEPTDAAGENTNGTTPESTEESTEQSDPTPVTTESSEALADSTNQSEADHDVQLTQIIEAVTPNPDQRCQRQQVIRLLREANPNPLSFAGPTNQFLTASDMDYLDYVENSPIHIRFRQREQAFRRAYRQAFEEWQQAEDKNSVNFPIGTYKMRVIYNLPCTAEY